MVGERVAGGPAISVSWPSARAWARERCHIARAALDGHQPVPAGSRSPLSQIHIRMLLGQMHLDGADLEMLAVQLTAALDGPLLLYLSAADSTATPGAAERIGQAWQDLVQRVLRP